MRRQRHSPSPMGRGLGGGATPCSSSTPTTGWHRMRCPASPLHSTHRPTLLRPPAPAHSSDRATTLGHRPATFWNDCWCATCSPMAGICCSAERPCRQPADSSPVSPTARTGNSAFASRFWVPSSRHASRQPVLFVRQHPGGAYQRLASDPAAFVPCMDAIFGNPDLLARFGPRRLAAIRRRTDAENHWIIGRELIRHGRHAEGRAWLRRSVRAAPTPKRAGAACRRTCAAAAAGRVARSVPAVSPGAANRATFPRYGRRASTRRSTGPTAERKALTSL